MNCKRLGSCLGLLALGSLPARAAHANPVTDWNDTAAVLVNEQSPMEQARALAIIQLAVYDALDAIGPRHGSHASDGGGRCGAPASPEAAIAAAARDTLLFTAPAHGADIEAAFEAAVAGLPAAAATERGLRIGSEAAERIIALRAGDDVAGALLAPYDAGTEPGDHRATPPDDIVVGAGWGELPTFAAPAAAAFRPPPPPALGSRRYARDYAEVAAIGVLGSTARSPEQTEIADFWYESSATGWMRIANVVARERALDSTQSARLLALVAVALADGFITGFDAKYHYDYWRPITGIAAGDTDGNPRTQADPRWAPYCPTPPVADYPSTHALLGAAAAAVLARELGDETPFSIDSLSLPGVTRSFERFSEAARENADSRVYCGIHWRSSVEAGLRQGSRLGRYVAEHALGSARAER